VSLATWSTRATRGEYLNSPYKYRDNDRREKGEKGMKGKRRAIVVGGGAD